MRIKLPLVIIGTLLLLGAGCAGSTPLQMTQPPPDVAPIDGSVTSPADEISPDSAVDSIIGDVLSETDSEESADAAELNSEAAAAAEVGNNSFEYEQ